MITKEQYEDEDAIKQDKKDFINFVLNNSKISYDNVLYFMMFYENLKSFEDNLRNLKLWLKINS